MLWRHGLLAKISKMGITGNVYTYIQNFLTNRTMQVRVGNKFSDTHTLENGTPQGSVISPILFVLMINAKNFYGSLTTVVRAHNDTPKTANITCTIFDRTLV